MPRDDEGQSKLCQLRQVLHFPVPIHSSPYPSLSCILSLALIPLTTREQKTTSSSVMVLTGYFWVVGLRRFVVFFHLSALLEFFIMDICHFHKSIKYMQVRSDTRPNSSSAFSAPNFFLIFDLQRTQSREISEILVEAKEEIKS